MHERSEVSLKEILISSRKNSVPPWLLQRFYILREFTINPQNLISFVHNNRMYKHQVIIRKIILNSFVLYNDCGIACFSFTGTCKIRARSEYTFITVLTSIYRAFFLSFSPNMIVPYRHFEKWIPFLINTGEHVSI